MEKNCKNKSNKKGFTLIELLVVIAIIGLLSSIVIASLASTRKKAEAAKIVQEMNQLKIALELYKTDHGKYPDGVLDSYTTLGIDYLKSVLVTGKYIPSISNPATRHPTLLYSPAIWATGKYLYNDEGPSPYNFTCGGKKLRFYLLEFYNGDHDLNFPRVGYYTVDNTFDVEIIKTAGEDNDHWYCIGE
jgi:prepilin-type N-terminal cleavage/methylation domain-containing protein